MGIFDLFKKNNGNHRTPEERKKASTPIGSHSELERKIQRRVPVCLQNVPDHIRDMLKVAIEDFSDERVKALDFLTGALGEANIQISMLTLILTEKLSEELDDRQKRIKEKVFPKFERELKAVEDYIKKHPDATDEEIQEFSNKFHADFELAIKWANNPPAFLQDQPADVKDKLNVVLKDFTIARFRALDFLPGVLSSDQAKRDVLMVMFKKKTAQELNDRDKEIDKDLLQRFDRALFAIEDYIKKHPEASDEEIQEISNNFHVRLEHDMKRLKNLPACLRDLPENLKNNLYIPLTNFSDERYKAFNFLTGVFGNADAQVTILSIMLKEKIKQDLGEQKGFELRDEEKEIQKKAFPQFELELNAIENYIKEHPEASDEEIREFSNHFHAGLKGELTELKHPPACLRDLPDDMKDKLSIVLLGFSEEQLRAFDFIKDFLGHANVQINILIIMLKEMTSQELNDREKEFKKDTFLKFKFELNAIAGYIREHPDASGEEIQAFSNDFHARLEKDIERVQNPPAFLRDQPEDVKDKLSVVLKDFTMAQYRALDFLPGVLSSDQVKLDILKIMFKKKVLQSISPEDKKMQDKLFPRFHRALDAIAGYIGQHPEASNPEIQKFSNSLNQRLDEETETIEKLRAEYIAEFQKRYNPYSVPGYTPPPRPAGKELGDEASPADKALQQHLDIERDKDHYIAAQLTAKEIYARITNAMAKADSKGVHAETLLAIIGAVSGKVCLDALLESVPFEDLNQGGVIDIYIVKIKSGAEYILGDRIGNLFSIVYDNAAADPNAHNNLLDLAREVAGKVGAPEYWETSFGAYVKESPRTIAENIMPILEYAFRLSTLYPYERVYAMGGAAQLAVKEAEKIMQKERALQIIAEFGWRTAHFLHD